MAPVRRTDDLEEYIASVFKVSRHWVFPVISSLRGGKTPSLILKIEAIYSSE
jgi:hypothetical protein